ncbi:MAG TPA: outer membrane protein assembly factor BamD [Phnomibacter sp.]|nr:outer membrane protein assembly factor BamD [Phnomibacter sp.]
MHWRVWLIGLVAFSLAGCHNINKILKSSDYEYKLTKANEFFTNKKYLQAQTIYEDVMPVFKGTPQYEDIYYNWAFCHYYQRDYLNAENIFKGFVENFPKSARAEECEFLRAYCFYKMSPKVELDQTPSMKAITYLQTFINTHPTSNRNKEAASIIDALRQKQERKEFLSAELYYNLGYYKAAATAFTQLMGNFPDAERSDEYKLMTIRSWYKYAEMSIPGKQEERFEKVLNECADFVDRFPDSKLLQDVERYKALTDNNLKNIKNEQAKAST